MVVLSRVCLSAAGNLMSLYLFSIFYDIGYLFYGQKGRNLMNLLSINDMENL